MPRIFNIALELMEKECSLTLDPQSFQKYISDNNLPRQRTCAAISIDSFDRLPAELKESGTMVFRLGSASDKRHTQFGLARYDTGWSDYFLFDDQIFSDRTIERFETPSQTEALLSFQFLPALTESSYVNLALASGLIGHALGLDDGQIVVPATGQSTASFDVRARPDARVPWEHNKGQVEIDSLFIASRGGQKYLFVIEAKRTTGRADSLAKHKLVYPVLALRQRCKELPIVPVYVRAGPCEDGVLFSVAECIIDNGSQTISGLRAIPDRSRNVLLPDFGRHRAAPVRSSQQRAGFNGTGSPD